MRRCHRRQHTHTHTQRARTRTGTYVACKPKRPHAMHRRGTRQDRRRPRTAHVTKRDTHTRARTHTHAHTHTHTHTHNQARARCRGGAHSLQCGGAAANGGAAAKTARRLACRAGMRSVRQMRRARMWRRWRRMRRRTRRHGRCGLQHQAATTAGWPVHAENNRRQQDSQGRQAVASAG